MKAAPAAAPAASLSAAEAFGLKDRGLIAPGKRADIVVIDSLEGCHAALVLAGGVVADDAAFAGRATTEPVARNSVKAPPVEAGQFRTGGNRVETPVIGILPGKIINGFVRGFALKSGAIASTVCHDHHNIAVVGADYADMALAANRLVEIEGGFVVVEGGRVLAELPLPVAGLMSLASFEEVREELVKLRAAARSLGVVLEEPFLQLAFLCLPVIPHLKITDFGMVDVDLFEVIP